MENEFKKRSQIEEILKASGAPAEALRILAGNYNDSIPINKIIRSRLNSQVDGNLKFNEMLSNFHGDSYEFLMLLTSQMILPRSLEALVDEKWASENCEGKGLNV